MNPQDNYLLEEKEVYDESSSLLDQYDLKSESKVQNEIGFILNFAEEEIKQLLDLHHLYATEGEFFPIIELGEIREMGKKCTTN